jgi:hypothetical protein
MDTSENKELEYCETLPGKWVKVVRDMICELEFGEVQLSVHRGRVTEVRKLEKFRFAESGSPGPPPGAPTATGHVSHEKSDTKCHRESPRHLP